MQTWSKRIVAILLLFLIRMQVDIPTGYRSKRLRLYLSNAMLRCALRQVFKFNLDLWPDQPVLVNVNYSPLHLVPIRSGSNTAAMKWIIHRYHNRLIMVTQLQLINDGPYPQTMFNANH